jgi:hypothetical protein
MPCKMVELWGWDPSITRHACFQTHARYTISPSLGLRFHVSCPVIPASTESSDATPWEHCACWRRMTWCTTLPCCPWPRQ